VRRVTVLRIATPVLDDAANFFTDRGSYGYEGTALIGGIPGRAADRLIIPDQHATPAPRASVRVTEQGELDILGALTDHERYFARIHSHPCEAFHSPTDDDNPVLTQQGALSIVVPWFGLGLRHGLDACAVFIREGQRWRELPPGPERNRCVSTG